MARFHLVMNAGTGETSQVPFSSQEEAAADAAALANRHRPLAQEVGLVVRGREGVEERGEDWRGRTDFLQRICALGTSAFLPASRCMAR